MVLLAGGFKEASCGCVWVSRRGFVEGGKVMERKLYECKGCGRLVPVRSKGLCPSCRAKGKPKKRSAKKSRPGLSDFFRDRIEYLETFRMSYTGRPIHSPSACNVCHILPKRYYKSVAMDADNIVYLTEEEHTAFDGMLDRMDFDALEKVFPVVWRRAVSQVRCMVESGRIAERGRLLDGIEERYFKDNNK